MPAPQNTGPDARSNAAHAADTSDPRQGLAAVASLRRLTDALEQVRAARKSLK